MEMIGVTTETAAAAVVGGKPVAAAYTLPAQFIRGQRSGMRSSNKSRTWTYLSGLLFSLLLIRVEGRELGLHLRELRLDSGKLWLKADRVRCRVTELERVAGSRVGTARNKNQRVRADSRTDKTRRTADSGHRTAPKHSYLPPLTSSSPPLPRSDGSLVANPDPRALQRQRPLTLLDCFP